ncbi:MAG: DNA-binding protein Alba [Candidatus Bathyarchaeia archaeon]|nr:DNA-binding protein Alba [Candidatus Bathyarchaeota archaeon]
MEGKNVIYVGQKPVMSYCLAVLTALRGGNNEVSLLARGRAISKAVDVAEVVRNQFMKDLKVKNISIGTETLETEGGSSKNISNIEIVLAKG